MTDKVKKQYAIQVNKDGEWVWSLYYDKFFTTKEEAKNALKNQKKGSGFPYRIVEIVPVGDSHD